MSLVRLTLRPPRPDRWLVLPLMCAIATLVSTQAQAQDPMRGGTFSYHPAHKWDLGSSFDIADPGEPKQRCVASKRTPFPSNDPRATLSMEVIRSSDELRHFLSVDASLDVSFSPGASGNAYFSLSTDKYFRADTLTAVLRGQAEYGYDEISEPEAVEGLDRLSATQLRQRCGTHYVSKVARGAMVAVVFTARSLTDEEKRTLAAGVSYDGVSVSGSVDFFESFSRLRKNGRASIDVLSSGGEGLSAFKSFVSILLQSNETVEDLGNRIGGALQELFEQHGRANAAKLSVDYRPLTDIPGFAEVSASLMGEVHSRRLADLVSQYREVDATIEVANGILDGSDPRRFVVLGEFASASSRERLESAVRSLRQYQSSVARRHDLCRQSRAEDDCRLPDYPDLGLTIPAWPPDPLAGTRIKLREPTEFSGNACPSQYQMTLEAEPVSRAYLDRELRQVRRDYRALNPSSEPAIVFTLSGENLTSVGRIAFVPHGTQAVRPPPVLVQNINLFECGAVFELVKSDGTPGDLLAIVQTFLASRGPASGTFMLEVTDAFKRRFLVRLLDWTGNEVRGLAELPACTPSNPDQWQCTG